MERPPRDYGESTHEEELPRGRLRVTPGADPTGAPTGPLANPASNASAGPSMDPTVEWERGNVYAEREVAGMPTAAVEREDSGMTLPPGGERVIELREEQLVAHKEMREIGEVQLRTVVEEVPGRLEVEAYREEVEVEHVPVGQVVTERMAPWEEDEVLVVPVYEEQLVVVKRLLLREHLRIRRVGTRETRLFEDTLRRERLVVEDPANTGLVHEQYPADEERQGAARADADERAGDARHEEGGFLQNLMRKALQ